MLPPHSLSLTLSDRYGVGLDVAKGPLFLDKALDVITGSIRSLIQWMEKPMMFVVQLVIEIFRMSPLSMLSSGIVTDFVCEMGFILDTHKTSL